jgi:hypothetical protein
MNDERETVALSVLWRGADRRYRLRDKMKSAIHFVGFTGEDFHRAIAVFGAPDFIHRYNDGRFRSMVVDDDVVVFANGSDVANPSVYSFDDSSVM